MAVIEFKDYPDTTTPYMAENLNKIQEGNVYSTSEIEVGKWVNNEPLYRKCLIFNDEIVQGGTTEVAHNILDAKFVMVKNAYVYNPTNGSSYSLPITLYNSQTTMDKLSISADRAKVYFYMDSGWNTGWYKVIILEYTKYEEQEES